MIGNDFRNNLVETITERDGTEFIKRARGVILGGIDRIVHPSY